MDKSFIDAEKYAFFRTDPDLRNTAYLVVSGSRGYGTENENSDTDLRGFLVESKRRLLGSENFEQFEDLPTDTVVYGLKKYFALCKAANPNALELLGADEGDIVVMNEIGRKVRDNAGIFLSKRVISSFGDYASAQLRRLSNALCHDQSDAQAQENHLRDTLSSMIGHFNKTYAPFGKNAIKLYFSGAGRHEILADIHLEGYPLRDFAGIYSEMRETMKTYEKLNHRNRKKDDAHLHKHAMHLIRLLITGMDILNGKGVITKRKEEHNFFMDIRDGKYAFDELFPIVGEYQSRFAEAAKGTKLPDAPDLGRIEALQIQLLESVL